MLKLLKGYTRMLDLVELVNIEKIFYVDLDDWFVKNSEKYVNVRLIDRLDLDIYVKLTDIEECCEIIGGLDD